MKDPRKTGGRVWLGRLRLMSLAAVVVLVLGWVGAQWVPCVRAVPGTNGLRTTAGQFPRIIAHGGGLGLQPENTREAFEASAALGCDMFEMDVRLTRDGILVTHHDASVERTSNGKGLVAEHDWEELASLNFGCHFTNALGESPYRTKPAHIATLESLMVGFPAMPLVIELKDRGGRGRRAAEVLAALVRKHRREGGVLVCSFEDATIEAFRQVSGREVPTSTARGETRELAVAGLLRLERIWPRAVAAAVVPSHPRDSGGVRLASPGFLRATHARNMAVYYWTVNDPEAMRSLIELGADGIITDYPDRLRAVLADLRPK